jgi:hypothetical protein
MRGGSWTVLADPEGNQFCLVGPFDLDNAEPPLAQRQLRPHAPVIGAGHLLGPRGADLETAREYVVDLGERRCPP